MSPSNVDQKFIDEFFSAIAPIEKAYCDLGFSYVALKIGQRFVIVSGRVFMNTALPGGPLQEFSSPSIVAGHVKLPDLELDVRGLITKLTEGQITTPQGVLHFPSAPGGRYGASFTAFHADGLRNQTRINVLTLMGGQLDPVAQPDLDWELKASSPPYEGLQELLQTMGLAPITAPTITVEFVANNVAAIDAQTSRISGETAAVGIRVAKGLPRELFTLGYRGYLPGAMTERGTISSAGMQWTEGDKFDSARVEIPVRKGTLLNCTITYGGVAQSHFWISDPEQIQNPRRAVYETFDPKLENLRSILLNTEPRGQDARDFEMAVAWLLWMRGFSGAHLGAGRRSREAPDQVLVSPSGNFALVECTMGLLKADNKLAQLHQRAEAARRRLANSNNAHLRILPIIVTARTLAEVKPDIETAERLGILVVAREHLEQGLDHSVQLPEADKLYAEAEQAVSAALAKYQTQDTQPEGSFVLPPQ